MKTVRIKQKGKKIKINLKTENNTRFLSSDLRLNQGIYCDLL